MTDFLLGALFGGAVVWALGTLTLVAIRGAERGQQMATGYWDPNDEDEVETAHRRLLETDGRP